MKKRIGALVFVFIMMFSTIGVRGETQDEKVTWFQIPLTRDLFSHTGGEFELTKYNQFEVVAKLAVDFVLFSGDEDMKSEFTEMLQGGFTIFGGCGNQNFCIIFFNGIGRYVENAFVFYGSRTSKQITGSQVPVTLGPEDYDYTKAPAIAIDVLGADDLITFQKIDMDYFMTELRKLLN